MSGVKIYQSRVKAKTYEMDTQLEGYKENVGAVKKAINQLEETMTRLQGKAWDSGRQYIHEIQNPLLDTTLFWIDAQMDGNEKYRSAALALPLANCLDQDELERQLSSYEYKLDREYGREHPRYSRITYYRTVIRLIKTKLAAIDTFVRITNGIYDRSIEIQSILNRAYTEISKVHFDPTTNCLNFASVDRTWVLDSEWLRDTEKLKADGLTDEQIADAKAYGFSSKKVLSTWSEMKEKGIGSPEIKKMEALGYSFGRTVEVWKSLDENEDKHFFACLILGGEKKYLEAFGIDPNELSDNMTLAMAEYTGRLLEYGRKEEFINMNNALLNARKMYEFVYQNGDRDQSLMEYRDVYLERLYAGTALLLQADTVLLAAMEAEIIKSGEKMIPEGYEELYQKHGWEMDLCGYWASQTILIHRDGIHANDNQFHIDDITNYKKDGSGIDYMMGYFSDYTLQENMIEVNNTVRNGSQLKAVWDLKEVESLEKAKEQLLASYTLKVLGGATTAATAVYAAPEMAILVSLGVMAMDGSVGSVDGLDEMTSNQIGKMGIKTGNIALENLVNYAAQMSKLENNISTKERQMVMWWFGRGEMCSIGGEKGIAFSGFYDPVALCNLERLQTEGLGVMAGWDEEQMRAVVDAIGDYTGIEMEKIEKDAMIKDISKSIVEGGYQFVEENNGTYNVKSISQFGEAILEIEEATSDKRVPLPEGVQINFFTPKVGENE